jgi:1-acyl-sn-glycerol-3-phosphate acyltransferase
VEFIKPFEMQKLYTFILKLVGWKYSLKVEIPNKCVLCVAPHTSNWDFVIGMIFYKSIGGKPHILMKSDWFFFPIKYLLNALGAIPVDRKKKTSLSDQMVKIFHSRPNFQLAVAPEGTRKRNIHWKTGFYYIAMHAGVPITLASIDYAKKEVDIVDNFYPSGDIKGDIEKIKQYYKDVTGRFPKKFGI